MKGLIIRLLVTLASVAVGGAVHIVEGEQPAMSSPRRASTSVSHQARMITPTARRKPRHQDFDSLVGHLRGGATSDTPVDTFLNAVDMFGTGVFSFAGAVTAGKKGMDLFGMVLVATLTAVGGGTLRDLLLGTGTVFWIQQPVYVEICAAVAVLTFFVWPTLEQRMGWKDTAKQICFADAFGLGAFAVLGTQKAAALDLAPIMWVVSGVMTSTFGGIARDVLCLQRPRVLYPDRTLYATAPLMGSLAYLMLSKHMGMATEGAACISFCVTVTTRILSFNNPWRLPHWKSKEGTAGTGEEL
jgi:uncharacterized membrane protein YeiH